LWHSRTLLSRTGRNAARVLLAPLTELVSFFAPPLCWGCGFPARGGETLCLRCRRELRWLSAEPECLAGVEVWAPLAYEGPARELARALKFHSAAAVARAMAAPIAAGAPSRLVGPDTTLVPVPLHPARARRRGYNQAALLARELGRRAGLRVADCLVRRGGRGTQVGRDRAQRLDALSGAVQLRAEPPARPLLVDDVITTGATVAACAGVLGGAPAVAYARTPGR
jgi:ComF family protein